MPHVAKPNVDTQVPRKLSLEVETNVVAISNRFYKNEEIIRIPKPMDINWMSRK
jgi:hypothetical protein